MARAIFIGGTASHAGKSWMATAVCAWLRRNGVRVAPFKAQNMSNNSYPCAGGGEIGRAQVVQAAACGIEPEPDMNPVLLKPCSDTGSQVVLHGRVWRNLPAHRYYEASEYLFGEARSAFARLAERFQVIVIEGAGSIAEVNLKNRDFTNLRFAAAVGAPSLLVGDIDRGGVFASIVGTLDLLDANERSLIRAFAVNRFRGDRRLFSDGEQFLVDRTGLPCLGVFPYAADVQIEAEDGVSLDEAPAAPDTADIAIVRLPHISNFTDFRLLPSAAWIKSPVKGQFRIVILPGTKNTIGDLQWMRDTGLADWVVEQHRSGAAVLGVCGGYQMLGHSIADPYAVEADHGRAVDGLNLLPVRTTLKREKITRRVRAFTAAGTAFAAYEIHMGVTEADSGLEPFATLSDGTPEGSRLDRVAGTYLHGALESPAVLEDVLGIHGVAPVASEHQYLRLADWFAANADLRTFEQRFL
jgi:adenosylcobyric acid synthase